MDSEHHFQGEQATELTPDEEPGGDPVCWVHLVCEECGAITTEGHRPGCELAEAGGTGTGGDE